MSLDDFQSYKTPEGKAYLGVGPNEAMLVGGRKAGVYVGGGVSLVGPLAFNSSALKIRFSALAVVNPLALFGIPSTFATPTPTFIFSLPMQETVTEAIKSTALIVGFYASTQAAVSAIS